MSGQIRPLVVHPARHLPMDAEHQTRTLSAWKALLMPYLRCRRAAAGRLDTGPPAEASSGPQARTP